MVVEVVLGVFSSATDVFAGFAAKPVLVCLFYSWQLLLLWKNMCERSRVRESREHGEEGGPRCIVLGLWYQCRALIEPVLETEIGCTCVHAW